MTDQPGASQLPETTASLLVRARAGDDSARDRLLSRYLPILRRWAHGRLPAQARSLADTDDLVQVTLIRSLDHLKEFEPRREGAFLAYLRSALMNQIRDEIRRAARSREQGAMPEQVVGQGPSPLEVAISREVVEAYEAALASLPPVQQEAVVLRIELGFTHREVAAALDLPTPNAARMAVSRALMRLAEVMDGND